MMGKKTITAKSNFDWGWGGGGGGGELGKGDFIAVQIKYILCIGG